MGGNSSGSSNITDLERLTAAADARLKELSKRGPKVLFVCEKVDRASLEGILAQSMTFTRGQFSMLDPNRADQRDAEIRGCSIVVAFTDATAQCDFINSVIEEAVSQRKQGVHAKARDQSLIPSKALAFRWPSMRWERLEAMLA